MNKAIIVVMVLMLTGCANAPQITPQITPQMRMDRNNNALLNLDIGMSSGEVLFVMGSPSLNEAYESLNRKAVIIFFYYTQRQRQDGNETKDEMTPVVLEDGRLVGWGDEFYKNKMEIDVNINNQ